jgi:hypothetical protein
MNAFVNTLYRDVTCALAAVVITWVVSMAFVQSTAAPYGEHSGTTRHLVQA